MNSNSAPSTRPATVVLVHGAWHGAWCWATFQAELDRRGIPSLAIDLPGHGASTEPLTGMHGDAAHVGKVLDRLAAAGHGDVVLVGHSYGGAVITEAAVGRSDIAHLVYVTAFAIDAGESVMGALGSFERHDVDLGAAMVFADDGLSTTLDLNLAAGALYAACPPEAIAASLPRLSAQMVSTMVEECTGSPRDDVESTYVVCTQDRAIHPVHQEVLAARCSHRVVLDTDHSPFVSTVDDLADIIAPLSTSGAAGVTA